jgi:hypothetical protein
LESVIVFNFCLFIGYFTFEKAFILIKFQDQERKSSVIKDSFNPEWNEGLLKNFYLFHFL